MEKIATVAPEWMNRAMDEQMVHWFPLATSLFLSSFLTVNNNNNEETTAPSYFYWEADFVRTGTKKENKERRGRSKGVGLGVEGVGFALHGRRIGVEEGPEAAFQRRQVVVFDGRLSRLEVLVERHEARLDGVAAGVQAVHGLAQRRRTRQRLRDGRQRRAEDQLLHAPRRLLPVAGPSPFFHLDSHSSVVLSRFTWFYLVLPGFIWFYLVLLCFIANWLIARGLLLWILKKRYKFSLDFNQF